MQVIIYADGTSCAGRLPFVSMCDSLIVSHPLVYGDMMTPW